MVAINNISIDNFWALDKIKTIRPFGGGHINDTYLVETLSRQFILQRVNKKVFNTPKLVSNYELLVGEINSYQQAHGIKITPEIFKTNKGVHHQFDSENFAWRLVEFIPDAMSYDISPNPEISYEAAKAIGKYQLFLNTIDPDQPCDTISRFHDLPSRIKIFNETLRTCDKSLLAKAEEEINQVRALASIEEEAVDIMQHLTPRVNHNDTKLNNILFKDGNCLVIDLDTVMKGYVMFDYGDMVRSFTSPVLEDDQDIRKTKLRIDHFEALTKGYLEVLKEELTDIEKDSLIIGALYIIYEQVIRFLNDYLRDNIYYKTSYPEHNLVRTRTQLKLLKNIVEERSRLEKIIHLYT